MHLSLFVYWGWSQSVRSPTSDLQTCYQYYCTQVIKAAYDGSTQLLLPKLKLLSDVLPPSPLLQLEASPYFSRYDGPLGLSHQIRSIFSPELQVTIQREVGAIFGFSYLHRFYHL